MFLPALGARYPLISGPKPEVPAEELILWGVKMYAYSVIAQVRRILEGLILLAKAENTPATYVLGRHIFEWAAHTCYMSRNLTERTCATCHTNPGGCSFLLECCV